MYHWLKIVVFAVVFIYCLTTMKGTVLRYRESKDKYTLIEAAAKGLLIISSVILLIAEFIDK